MLKTRLRAAMCLVGFILFWFGGTAIIIHQEQAETDAAGFSEKDRRELEEEQA